MNKIVTALAEKDFNTFDNAISKEIETKVKSMIDQKEDNDG